MLRTTAVRARASLATSEFGQQGSPTAPLAVIAHGILGSRKNWRTPAKRLAAAFPHWRIVTADLRGHGDSPGGEAPHTLDACAEDLAQLFVQLGRTPHALVGHSFGGRTALQYLTKAAEGAWPAPPATWVLDVSPGRLHEDKLNVRSVLAAVQATPMPAASRDALLGLLADQGLPPALCQWLLTNTRLRAPGSKELEWTLTLDTVQGMYDSLWDAEFWPVLEQPPAGAEVNIVRALDSDGWPAEHVARLEGLSLSGEGSVRLHNLPDAGHWLHVDNPVGMHELLGKTFESW